MYDVSLFTNSFCLLKVLAVVVSFHCCYSCLQSSMVNGRLGKEFHF